MQPVARNVEEALIRALGESDWKVVQGMPPTDFIASRDGREVVVELKVFNGRPRLEALEHSLAAAALVARQHALDIDDGQGNTAGALAAIGADRLTENMVKKLRAFAERYLVDIAWCIVDSGGVRAVQGLDLPVLEGRAASAPEAPATPSTPFSDLGQWLIKVLVASDLDPRWIAGGRERSHFRTARELANFAKVSEPVVSVVLRELESRGFLQRRPTIRLVDRSRLFRAWSTAVQARPRVETTAKAMFGSSDPMSAIARRLQPGKSCFGLFSACEARGLRFVSSAPNFVLVRKLGPEVLHDLCLAPCEPEQPSQIIVRETPFPESVFRGVPASAPLAVDGLQCWLDLVHHPVRVSELATELWHAMEMRFDQP